MNTKPYQPWHHLWQTHGHARRGMASWGGVALTFLLLGVGVVIVWIALRGSIRLKAATGVWVLFP